MIQEPFLAGNPNSALALCFTDLEASLNELEKVYQESSRKKQTHRPTNSFVFPIDQSPEFTTRFSTQQRHCEDLLDCLERSVRKDAQQDNALLHFFLMEKLRVARDRLAVLVRLFNTGDKTLETGREGRLQGNAVPPELYQEGFCSVNRAEVTIPPAGSLTISQLQRLYGKVANDPTDENGRSPQKATLVAARKVLSDVLGVGPSKPKSPSFSEENCWTLFRSEKKQLHKANAHCFAVCIGSRCGKVPYTNGNTGDVTDRGQ
jgi:hypothetical protein